MNLTRLWLQAMPKGPFNSMMYRLTRWQAPPWLLQMAIERFAGLYHVNLEEVEIPEGGFQSFDEFFTRKLKREVREIEGAPEAIVSPADGVLDRYGPIENLELEQIKGWTYRTDDLLKSDYKAGCFEGGRFATIYLSPKDYHRVHVPCDGQVTEFHYIPGDTYPVNGPSVRSIPKLFTRNERLVVHLRTAHGPVAVVLVAAVGVSAITQSYDPDRRRFKKGAESKKTYFSPIPLVKGQELGMFHMGSTVILLFARDAMEFSEGEAGRPIKMGQSLGRWLR